MEDSNELSFEQLLDLISEDNENKKREAASKESQKSFMGKIFFSDKALLAALVASQKTLKGETFLDAKEYVDIFKALCVINPICRTTVAYPVHEVCVRLAGSDSERGAEILYFEQFDGGWTFRKGQSINNFGWIKNYSDPIRKFKKELIEYSNKKSLSLMANNTSIAISKLQKITNEDNILKVFNDIINADCFDEHFNTKEKAENFKANILAIIIANALLAKNGKYYKDDSLCIEKYKYETVICGLKTVLPKNDKFFDKVLNSFEYELINRFGVLDHNSHSYDYWIYQKDEILDEINALWGLDKLATVFKPYVSEVIQAYHDKQKAEKQDNLTKLKDIVASLNNKFTAEEFKDAIEKDGTFKERYSTLLSLLQEQKLFTTKQITYYVPLAKEEKKANDQEAEIIEQ